MIKEWNLLRVVACLSIVLLHSTTHTGRAVGYPEIEHYNTIRAMLCYATPAFVILSEIILAHKYPNGLPKGFWVKRFKFIILPYICFGIVDAFVSKHFNPSLNLFTKIQSNIFLGEYEGYFILIILQFYVLHWIVTKFKFSMMWFIPLSIILMEISLNILRLDNPFIKEYSHTIMILFSTWLGYFAIAFLIGKHYSYVATQLRKLKWYTILLVILSIIYVFIMTENGLTTVNSRRIDLFPLVVSLCLLILAWGQYIPKLKIINVINNYSFGIYLIHWQVQRFISPYTANYFEHTSSRVIALFVCSLVISIIIIRVIALLPFGTFIVGNIKRKWDDLFKRKLQTAAE